MAKTLESRSESFLFLDTDSAILIGQWAGRVKKLCVGPVPIIWISQKKTIIF
jgi:hypothetical protein